MRVGASNIDIEVELTFFGSRSLVERRKMDRDRNGVISSEETDAYLIDAAGMQEGGFRLLVHGRSLELLSLYEPELDLMGCNRPLPSPHVLRLFYFARRPEWLGSQSVIRLEDGLWLHWPAICTLEIARSPGARVIVDQETSPFSNPDPDGAPRVMQARCVSLPPKASAARPVRDVAGASLAGSAEPAAAIPGRFPVGLWIGLLTIVTVSLGCTKRCDRRRRE